MYDSKRNLMRELKSLTLNKTPHNAKRTNVNDVQKETRALISVEVAQGWKGSLSTTTIATHIALLSASRT